MPTSARPPAHVADLLRLVTRDPGRPRLTWYGDDGDRVELSGAVLENWVNKTANLLIEEYDAEPGTRIFLDLPVHWRTTVWALAAWRTGATLQVGDPGFVPTPDISGLDVVVTSRPEVWSTAGPAVVAVALPALARRFDGVLPAGAIDAASAVMTYGDRLGWVQDVDLAAVALERPGSDGAPVLHGELVGDAVGPGDASGAPGADVRGDVPPGARVLLSGADEPDAVWASLAGALAVWGVDGSVVLTSPSMTAALAVDPDRLARLVSTERITRP